MVDLHPVAIIVAVLLFGGLWGFWGVFFAIPLATVCNAILRAVINQNENSDASQEDQKNADAVVAAQEG